MESNRRPDGGYAQEIDGFFKPGDEEKIVSTRLLDCYNIQ